MQMRREYYLSIHLPRLLLILLWLLLLQELLQLLLLRLSVVLSIGGCLIEESGEGNDDECKAQQLPTTQVTRKVQVHLITKVCNTLNINVLANGRHVMMTTHDGLQEGWMSGAECSCEKGERSQDERRSHGA